MRGTAAAMNWLAVMEEPSGQEQDCMARGLPPQGGPETEVGLKVEESLGRNNGIIQFNMAY